MIIKKFQGKTEDEAVALAKKELGNGVVIMNVRTARKKGFLSIFKKSLIEVTVALEEEQEKPVFKPKPKPVRTPGKNPMLDNPNIIMEPEPNLNPNPNPNPAPYDG